MLTKIRKINESVKRVEQGLSRRKLCMRLHYWHANCKPNFFIPTEAGLAEKIRAEQAKRMSGIEQLVQDEEEKLLERQKKKEAQMQRVAEAKALAQK